jgi:hypothetical protein
VRPAAGHAADEVAATVEHGRSESEKDHHDLYLRLAEPSVRVTDKAILMVMQRPINRFIQSRAQVGNPAPLHALTAQRG